MDDASYVLVIRLGPKTSECEKNVTVVSTVTGCDVTNCATTLHGFNIRDFTLTQKVKKYSFAAPCSKTEICSPESKNYTDHV